MRNWEIGSYWYSDKTKLQKIENQSTINWQNTNSYSYLSTCRSIINETILASGKKGVAIVPAFTCHSVVDPFITNGFKIYAYNVNQDLTIDTSHLNELLNKVNPSVIILHSYFGFNTLQNINDLLKECIDRDILIIEDQTQSILSNFKRIPSHFKIGSIRKWCPIPDGAYVNSKAFNNLTKDNALETLKLDAMSKKADYIFLGKGEKSEFLNLFKIAENLLDSRTATYAISDYSFSYINNADWHLISNKRLQNYLYLKSRIELHSSLELIFGIPDPQEVPFMLPILVKNDRSDFQKYMASQKVYPTVIWSCPDILKNQISENVKSIYDSILCFHIDQRYDIDDMKKVADIIDNYFI